MPILPGALSACVDSPSLISSQNWRCWAFQLYTFSKCASTLAWQPWARLAMLKQLLRKSVRIFNKLFKYFCFNFLSFLKASAMASLLIRPLTSLSNTQSHEFLIQRNFSFSLLAHIAEISHWHIVYIYLFWCTEFDLISQLSRVSPHRWKWG